MAQTIHARARDTMTATRNPPSWRTPSAWGWPLRWLLTVAVMGGPGAYHWFVYTARPDLPHRFTALEDLFRIGVAAAIILLGLLCGLRILRPLRVVASLSRVEVFALGAGLGLGILSLFTLILGLLHLYYPVTFILLLAFGPWLFPAERRQVASALGEIPATLSRMARNGAPLFEKLACLLLAALSLSAMALYYTRDLTLPASSFGYDTYQYHWAIPALLLRAHVWQGFPGWAHANLPFTTEMLNLIAIGLRAPTAANFVQDTFGVLFAMLVFGLLRRHFGTVVAWFAVAAVATIPLLIAYTSQSYVEMALLFYGFASLTLLVLWLVRGLGVGRSGVEALALAGVALGFALSVKYTALEYLPGLALLLFAGCGALLVRARDAVARRTALLLVARLALAFCLGAAAPMLPWFAKNWIYDGNPVYPALTGLFGGPAWDAARDQTLTSTFQHFGPKIGLVARLHLYALDLFAHPERYAETTPFPTGHLAWCAALALPAVAFVLWRGWLTRTDRRRGQAITLIALTLATSGCLLVWNQSGALVERYAIPPVTLATVLGAALLGWLATAIFAHARISTTVRILRPAQLAAWALLLLVAVISAKQERSYLWQDVRLGRTPLPLLTGSISEDQYRLTRLSAGMPTDFWQMTQYVNDSLPHDGKLLMLGRGTGYFFDNRDYVADSGGDWIPYIVAAGKSPEGMLALLQRQGFTYVVYDAQLVGFLEHKYENRVLTASVPTYLAFQQRDLTWVATWGNLSLYRVPAAVAATSP
ncbi:MAG TPA: hypothetical protein VJN88_04100 [Ktedonobacterales bacterium]|nr:hypothetical protein [Ktedonobacterales bacterium]